MIQESDWTQACKILEIRHSPAEYRRKTKTCGFHPTTKVFSIQAEKTLARRVQTDEETKQPLQGTVA
jgi:hypothetical protein